MCWLCWAQVFDDEITSKWRAEAKAQDELHATEKVMDYIIEELKFKAMMYKEAGMVYVFDGDVVKSDVKVPKSLQESLKAAVAPLENVPEEEKDYHPGSDDQVLDLVHPSLFPLVYGRTRVMEGEIRLNIQDGIKRSGEGKVAKYSDLYPESRYRDVGWSTQYQWLPCDVSFVPVTPASDDLDAANHGCHNFRCKINSYINNLHPDDHGDLYSVVEELITRAVPLWNMTLSSTVHQLQHQRISCTLVEYDPDPDDIPEDQRPPQGEDEDEDDYWDRMQEWEAETRKVVIPEPEGFRSRSLHQDYKFLKTREEVPTYLQAQSWINLFEDFKESGLQVIVKLANIHLTPEKPEYPGGSWHVEGQRVRILGIFLDIAEC